MSTSPQNSESSCPVPVEPVFTTSSASISFSGGTKTGPGFEKSFTLTVPAGNIYTISVSADDSVVVSGAEISAESHWDATKKCIIPGSATSQYVDISEGTTTVPFSVIYKNKGGPYSLSAKVTSTLTSSPITRSSNASTANSSNASLFDDKPCIAEYIMDHMSGIVNSLLREWLSQSGINDPIKLPWEPPLSEPFNWNTTVISPEIIYRSEEYSVRAGMDFDPTSGEIGLSVDVYTSNERIKSSAGVRFSTNGEDSSIAIQATFKF